MNITKYVHSCLLVETPEQVTIFDPGAFSWESGLFDIGALQRLDNIIITHEHPDHMHLPFLETLVAKFPEARITTTDAAAAQLKKAGFANLHVEGNENIEFFPSKHETIEPLASPPENIGVHYLGRLSHPGDSHHFTETKKILALPVTAPWGTIARAAALGLELKPKHIIPIHDWHWNPEARTQAYNRLAAFFKDHDIQFAKPVDGETLSFDAGITSRSAKN